MDLISSKPQMRNNTQDTMKAAVRGARCGLIACAIVAVFAIASGDSASQQGVNMTHNEQPGVVAGVLLSPRTRLIIDYQRTALA